MVLYEYESFELFTLILMKVVLRCHFSRGWLGLKFAISSFSSFPIELL